MFRWLPIVFCLLTLSCKDDLVFVKETNQNHFVDEYYKDPDTGLKEGLAIRYDPQGRKESESHYRKGELHGKRRIFSPDGALIIVESYRKGIFHGVYESYHENGNVKVSGKYRKGAMMGRWKKYYDNGKLEEIVHFENNLENGPFREYYADGKIKAKGHYFDGDQEHGELLLYDVHGRLEKKMLCDNGKCETVWIAKAEP